MKHRRKVESARSVMPLSLTMVKKQSIDSESPSAKRIVEVLSAQIIQGMRKLNRGLSISKLNRKMTPKNKTKKSFGGNTPVSARRNKDGNFKIECNELQNNLSISQNCSSNDSLSGSGKASIKK